MSNYELGKDIQNILQSIQRLEERLNIARDPSILEGKCGKPELVDETGELIEEGKKEFLVNGQIALFTSKRFRFPSGRLCNDKCNWREDEFITIWHNGRYEDTTEIKCEHGWLFACYFEVTMKYKDNSGNIITTTDWNEKLAGGDSYKVSKVGYNRGIELSFNDITQVTRSRYAEC